MPATDVLKKLREAVEAQLKSQAAAKSIKSEIDRLKGES